MLTITLRRAFIALILISSSAALGENPKPKYGKDATPLSIEHSSFQKNLHPDFWALMPYYLPQRDGGSCSLASMTMIMNALLESKKTNAADMIFTQDSLLTFSNDQKWRANLKTKGMTLKELKDSTEALLKKSGIKKYSVMMFQPPNQENGSLVALRKILAENEQSNGDFIVINYLQGVVTGDSDVGHIAPIAAYDEKNHRVLILDPDREWYQPYWASDETLLKAMTTIDPVSQANRGLLWIKML